MEPDAMITFTYQRAMLCGRRGWIATRRIDGVFAGRMFGATKRQAAAQFD
jgi:hypothetical protein